jgi:hypothetical protein
VALFQHALNSHASRGNAGGDPADKP